MLKVIYPVIGNERLLPFYLSGIGMSDPEYCVERKNGLVSHQFLITLGGRGILTVGGRDFPQREGSCFYLSPGVAHSYHPENGEWKTAWIVFRGDELERIMLRLGFPPYLAREQADTDGIMRIYRKIFSEAQERLGGAESCSGDIYALILEARRCMLGEQGGKSAPDIAEKAIKYIESHFSEDITLERLADEAGVSVQHFCRRFKTKTGLRPVEYIARRRIAEAKRLLLNSGLSVSQIAAEVGYSGVTYFGMVFGKYEGISPSAFRKSNGYGNM